MDWSICMTVQREARERVVKKLSSKARYLDKLVRASPLDVAHWLKVDERWARV